MYTQLITDTASSGGFPSFIISIIQRLYGSSANQTIVRFNDFSNIAAYFLQKVSIHSFHLQPQVLHVYLTFLFFFSVEMRLCAFISDVIHGNLQSVPNLHVHV